MSHRTEISVRHDTLVMGPARITFQRTLRIPESGLHDLPPGFGPFPLRRVQDYPDTAPPEWLEHGGVMLPVHQFEAMWLDFRCAEPAALQVGIGKVCAISGESWHEELGQDPQNYVPLPEQPWLDGINAGDGFIRQFVAVPLGLGATVEGQVTGEAAPGSPIDREAYVAHGLPWFDYYDADHEDLAPSQTLSEVAAVGELLGEEVQPFTPVDPGSVITLKDAGGDFVAGGSW